MMDATLIKDNRIDDPPFVLPLGRTDIKTDPPAGGSVWGAVSYGSVSIQFLKFGGGQVRYGFR